MQTDTLGPMRTNLSVEDLGTFLDEPRVAVLATLRVDGTVLLSPVYHEWREGAFNVVIETQNVKARHLRRDPRATIVVAESDPPLRGVEVRGSAQCVGGPPSRGCHRRQRKLRQVASGGG